MQQALVVLAGNRVLRLRQVEGDGSVFEHDRAGGLGEKILQGVGKGVWGHAGIVHIRLPVVCDE